MQRAVGEDERASIGRIDTKRTTHRRVVVSHRGGPEVLEVVEEALPRPEPGEIRVRTLAAGISGMDLMVRSRRFPGFPRVPFTPGVDVVGVVDELGAGVSGIEPGETVAALLGHAGGYAEHVCVPVERAVPVPSGVDPAEASCVVTNHLTAYTMMHRVAEVKPGHRILIQGAGGGVGTALLELGRLAGLEMYGTASPYNHDLVASYGATPIDYHTEDFVERVRELTGDGVDAVFDPIGGGRQLRRSYRALRKGGRLVWFGVAAQASQGIRVIPASLVTRLLLSLLPDGKKAPLAPDSGKPVAQYRETVAMLFQRLADGELHPVVAERVPLDEAARAHEVLERGGYAGRVVLVADGSREG
ncbi:MAG TPA: zinc-binding dehydrogenase [Actinomycetota bacterium]|nr:zinc-binding dehydrogenase [Actinomycetota bacterium]